MAEIKLGPVRLPKQCRQNGELKPDQRHAIKAKTGASASCRQRSGWPEKGLVVCGPRGADLLAAETMAKKLIVENEKANRTEGQQELIGEGSSLPPREFLQTRTSSASSSAANADVVAQQLLQQMQQQVQCQFQLQTHNLFMHDGQMPMYGVPMPSVPMSSMPMPMPGVPMPSVPMSSMPMPGMPMPSMPMDCMLPPGLPVTSLPGRIPMWYAGDEVEARLNSAQREKSEPPLSGNDDDDSGFNCWWLLQDEVLHAAAREAAAANVPAEQQVIYLHVEESDKKKDAAQAVEESDKRKDAAQAVEESDSDVAEDKMHPVNAVAKARVLTPRSEARLVPASKYTKQDMADLAVAITTNEWKTIGASSRHKFVYNLFDGKHCVLKRLEAGFARTINTKRIAVYLDCRCFHSKASHTLTPHLGKHIKILGLIAADEKLIELFKEVIMTIQVADEAGLPADMLLVCTSGIHRGPAAGLIIYEMLKRDGREMMGKTPMNLSDSTEKWCRKCSTCKDCMADGLRRALYDNLYDSLWVPLSVSMYSP